MEVLVAMNGQDRQRPARRAVVVGVGPRGRAILQALQRRLNERGRRESRLALLAVAGQFDDGSSVGAAGSRALAAAPVGSVTGELLHADLGQGGAQLTAALVAQLMAISRVQPGANVWSGPAKLSPEIDVLVTAALDDPLAGDCLLDIVYLVRQLARERLNAAAQITGLLILPDLDADGDPEPAQAASLAALQRIDQVMAVHDGWVTRWDQGPVVEGWGPPFDRGCFLLSPLNGQSLALGSPEERNELAAEILQVLATTDAARLCETPASAAAWRWGTRAHGYGGIGVAAWVFPVERLIEHASRRMAVELLESWQTPRRDAPCDWAAQAAAFWQSADASRAALAARVLPGELFDHGALWQPLDCRVTPATARRLRQALDEQMAGRLEDISAQRPALDQQVEAIGQQMAQRLADALGRMLDLPAAGRLPEGEAWLAAAVASLRAAQQENAVAGEAAWQALEAVEGELEQTGQRLEARAAAGGFPEPGWRTWAAVLLRPRRLWALAQTLPDLQRLAASFAALLLRQTDAALMVLRHDLIDAVYEAALTETQRQSARVTMLRQAAAAAQDGLHPPPDAPTGALGFSLEMSALTPALVEELYRQMRGAPAELLLAAAASPARLGGWPGVEVDSEDLAGAVLDCTRTRCRALLAGMSIDDLVVQALPDPQARLEALRDLVESATPFLPWDETRLAGDDQDVVYSCALLGLGDGAAASALSGMGEVLFGQVLTTGDQRRVTALCAVQGLPLAAVTGGDTGDTTADAGQRIGGEGAGGDTTADAGQRIGGEDAGGDTTADAGQRIGRFHGDEP
jgi:hypothetical protein